MGQIWFDDGPNLAYALISGTRGIVTRADCDIGMLLLMQSKYICRSNFKTILHFF